MKVTVLVLTGAASLFFVLMFVTFLAFCMLVLFAFYLSALSLDRNVFALGVDTEPKETRIRIYQCIGRQVIPSYISEP